MREPDPACFSPSLIKAWILLIMLLANFVLMCCLACNRNLFSLDYFSSILSLGQFLKVLLREFFYDRFRMSLKHSKLHLLVVEALFYVLCKLYWNLFSMSCMNVHKKIVGTRVFLQIFFLVWLGNPLHERCWFGCVRNRGCDYCRQSKNI